MGLLWKKIEAYVVGGGVGVSVSVSVSVSVRGREECTFDRHRLWGWEGIEGVCSLVTRWGGSID